MYTIFLNQVDSTNLEARRRWLADKLSQTPTPFAIVAAQQTAGIGRSGRTWHSPVGGLWLSVIWPLRLATETYAAAPLAVGLAAAEALQTCCELHCVIKWPNDLLVNEKKIAGVLCKCELGGDRSIIIAGVGINANFPVRRLGRDLRQPATSISDELGKLVNLQTLREVLVDNIRKYLELMETGGFAAIVLPRIQLRLAWRNQAVVYGGDDSEPRLEGVLTHVDDAGRAVIVTGSGRQTVSCGELRLHRMAGRTRSMK